MNIVIMPAAAAEINKNKFQNDEAIRIEAIYVGSCSIYAEHHLLIDEKGEDDALFMIDGIPVLVSKESQKLLHDQITLDFNPSLGYKLSSAEEVYKYNLQIARK
ncbi:Fe-S cluster assembly iron-binding protein IscA [Peribacillus deserti]|uniref:Fe-S cluster assembly iron-binding protein IscA n=1 Tax=Peribacillus deserti TaxID=673318 RepID=A0ABS2QDX0_9BACI|nr:iron-sulfur cluster biosynthesis family protein [Peribacillus deserti]MBM7691004.1 Fe-S cluster assembly iron-binding protein IscA [Peribacillus deserti]